jgi:hypothetical protein
MTDWKAFCIELLSVLDDYDPIGAVRREDTIARVRAYLAQPEPAGPTDKELDEALFQALDEYMRQKSPFGGPTDEKQLDRAKARAVLKRWGR